MRYHAMFLDDNPTTWYPSDEFSSSIIPEDEDDLGPAQGQTGQSGPVPLHHSQQAGACRETERNSDAESHAGCNQARKQLQPWQHSSDSPRRGICRSQKVLEAGEDDGQVKHEAQVVA